GDEMVQLFPIGEWKPMSSYDELKDYLKSSNENVVEELKDETFVRKLNKLDNEIDVDSKISQDEKPFPKAFEFSLDSSQEVETEDVTLTETEINDPKKNDFDKTQIAPDTVEYLKELRKKKEKQRLENEKLEKDKKNEVPAYDLENDATMFLDTSSLKNSLR